MGRRNENTRHSTYVLRIVCEGEKTEPLFFTSLCKNYSARLENMDVRTIPMPVIPEDNDDTSRERGKYKSKKRSVGLIDNEPVIAGVPPLKWVLHAKKIIHEEGVDEAWAVFDKDQHPASEEAFNEAETPIDGKKVNIAFSSRSFEYYLLLHFEYLYKAFPETECAESDKLCGTDSEDERNCHGQQCINGYARMNGYWTDSKSVASTYELVKDKLLKGMCNAVKLRAESNEQQHDVAIYNRNPYTDVDKLVGRLIGVEGFESGKPFDCNEHGDHYKMVLDNGNFVCENAGVRAILLKSEDFQIYDVDTGLFSPAPIDRKFLQPGEKYSSELTKTPSQILVYQTIANQILFL